MVAVPLDELPERCSVTMHPEISARGSLIPAVSRLLGLTQLEMVPRCFRIPGYLVLKWMPSVEVPNTYLRIEDSKEHSEQGGGEYTSLLDSAADVEGYRS